ncbi:hypothetical protein TcWFU_008546 [Taenia crassiceps]|uniref:Uncharacterized protein n=1 Tax=Taenia crassiceps TaxID=6207 RepID=A0ABR4QML8_9CEST
MSAASYSPPKVVKISLVASKRCGGVLSNISTPFALDANSGRIQPECLCEWGSKSTSAISVCPWSSQTGNGGVPWPT